MVDTKPFDFYIEHSDIGFEKVKEKDLEFRAHAAELQAMSLVKRLENLEKKNEELRNLLIKSSYHLIIEDNPFS